MATTYAIYAAVAFLGYVICCLLIASGSGGISLSVGGTYAVLGVGAITSFAWPVLLARAFQEWMRTRKN